MNDKKYLVAYFSLSGNTKSVAEKIADCKNADLFEIKPVEEYPTDYTTVVNIAKKEKNNDYQPDLVDYGDVSDYDVIFIGTPVWWYTMAQVVKAYVLHNDFLGKIIVPFCTHGGGGASSTYSDLQKYAPDATILNGLTVYGDAASLEDVQSWIRKLNI